MDIEPRERTYQASIIIQIYLNALGYGKRGAYGSPLHHELIRLNKLYGLKLTPTTVVVGVSNEYSVPIEHERLS